MLQTRNPSADRWVWAPGDSESREDRAAAVHACHERRIGAVVIAIAGAAILTKTALDIYGIWPGDSWRHEGWYLLDLIGVLLGSRLMQRAVSLVFDSKRTFGDALLTVLASLWMPAAAFSSLHPSSALSWCVPLGVILVFFAPAWAVSMVSALNVLTVGAVSAVRFDTSGISQIVLVMGATSLSCAYFRGATESLQRRLAEQLGRIEMALSSTGAGAVEWDAQTNTCLFSGRFKEILGYDASKALPSQDFLDYVHPEDRDEIRHSVAIQLKEATGQDCFRMRPYDYRLVDQAGDAVWIHAEAYVLGDDRGGRYIVCTVMDISDVIRIKGALDAANRQIQRQAQRSSEQAQALARAVQLRQQLERLVREDVHKRLSDVAAALRDGTGKAREYVLTEHECRQAATSCAAISAGAGHPAVNQNDVSSAMAAIDAAVAITESALTFLDFRAIEEGRFECELGEFDLWMLVSDVVARLQASAKSRCVDLNAPPATILSPVKVDARLCSLCLESAVTHALMLAPAGTQVTLQRYKAPGVGLRIGVECHLEPARLRAMLEPGPMDDWRQERLLSMHEARLGTQAAGGRLIVSSSSANGTRFDFEFPCPDRSEAVPPCPQPPVTWPTRNAKDNVETPGAQRAQDVQEDPARSTATSGLAAELPVAEKRAPVSPRTTLLLATEDAWTRRHTQKRTAGLFELHTVQRSADAIDAFTSRRFDIVALCPELQGDASVLARQMRRMQEAAFEDPSLFVALMPSGTMTLAMRGADFDRVLCLPLQPDALMELAATIESQRAEVPASPWIEAKILRVYPDYLASRMHLVAQLLDAMRGGRHQEASVIAHTLRGSPGLHGFDAVLATCKAIEGRTGGGDADLVLLNEVGQLATMFESAPVR